MYIVFRPVVFMLKFSGAVILYAEEVEMSVEKTHSDEKMPEQRHVFGPVPSRRLGLSLGVDLVPYKTCTYNCIYCQLGACENTTTIRRSFCDPDKVIDEVRNVIESGTKIDYITFSGSGEPTLSSDLGKIIRGVKKINSAIPVAVLTNGSLLWRAELREELAAADLVAPSLDAVSEEVWRAINRPDPNLDFRQVIDGIRTFCNENPEKIDLEIMFVRGINDTEAQLQKFREYLRGPIARKIQLNSVVRPPAEASARPIEKASLEKIKKILEGPVPVEIIAEFRCKPEKTHRAGLEQAIVQMLSRRPCGLDEMASSLGVHRQELVKSLTALKAAGRIEEIAGPDSGRTFYQVAR